MIGAIRLIALMPSWPGFTGKICRNTSQSMKLMDFTLYTLEAVHQWDVVNSWLDVLMMGSQEEKTALYRDFYRMEVQAV